MYVIDLTQTLSNETMSYFPDTEPVKLEMIHTIEKSGFRETLMYMTSHAGTHIDAPAHVLAGHKMLDEMRPMQFVGKALVIDCRNVPAGKYIDMEHINRVREKADQADFILFCTGWDRYWGENTYLGDYPIITKEVVDYLVEYKKKGVGFDTLSMDPIADVELCLHKQLFLQRDGIIMENLTNLDKVGEEIFLLAALPLKYEHADGAPARVVAILKETGEGCIGKDLF